MPVIVMFLPESRLKTAKMILPQDWDLRLMGSPSPAETLAACQDADCILTLGTAAAIDAAVLENSPKLKLVQCLGAGFNHVDLAAANRLGIPVANSPGQNAATVAEFTIGTFIVLQRRIIEADNQIKAGNYACFRKELLAQGLGEINGSRIGLVGFGNIGQKVAKIAGMLGASVSYFNLHRRSSDLENSLNVEYRPLDSLLSTSDIVSLHVPLNTQTKGLIGARELALMPSGSLLVNTSRGEVIDQTALAAALETGHLASAAIDTVSPEPPGANHPLINLSPAASARLMLTPHIAGVTVASFRKMLAASIANMERALRGEQPHNLVKGIK